MGDSPSYTICFIVELAAVMRSMAVTFRTSANERQTLTVSLLASIVVLPSHKQLRPFALSAGLSEEFAKMVGLRNAAMSYLCSVHWGHPT
jgi:hypothetical protein